MLIVKSICCTAEILDVLPVLQEVLLVSIESLDFFGGVDCFSSVRSQPLAELRSDPIRRSVEADD